MNIASSLPVIFAANPTAWLTPICLIGFGCLGGLIVLAVLYGLAKLILPSLAEIAEGTLKEGFVTPVLSIAAAFAGFSLLSLLLSAGGVGYLPLSDIGRSLARLPMSNSFSVTISVPTVAKEERGAKPQEVPLDFRPQELRSVEVRSDQDLEFLTREIGSFLPGAVPKRVVLNRNEPWHWPSSEAEDQSNPFTGRRATFYVFNPT